MGSGTLVFSLLFLFLTTSTAQITCSTYSFRNNQSFSNCVDLPVLNAFIHWTYNSSSNSANIGYRVTGVSPSSSWIAWALNPTGAGMIGSQALVAAHQNSSSALLAYTTSVTSYASTTLAPSTISFQVNNLTAISENNEMIIFATITPPNTTMNMVWQVGPIMSNGAPAGHPVAVGSANIQSFGPIHFLNPSQTISTETVRFFPTSDGNGTTTNNGAIVGNTKLMHIILAVFVQILVLFPLM